MNASPILDSFRSPPVVLLASAALGVSVVALISPAAGTVLADFLRATAYGLTLLLLNALRRAQR